MKRDLLDLSQLSPDETTTILALAAEVKKNPTKYAKALEGQTLLMIFEKPSLRTRVSFETGMTRLGGHAIFYDLSTSPMGKKESVADTAKCASRYADIIMARLFSHKQMIDLAKNSRVPVINALDDYSHPCQILADLQTIKEKKGTLKGLKLTYLGDSNNNVTHSLILGCTKMGMEVAVGCPLEEAYQPQEEVLKKARAANEEATILVTDNAEEAIKDADVVYTDSWMSYHIPESEKETRFEKFMPFQVTKELMQHAKEDAIFLHCLPAQRGVEVTGEVIDGRWSVVFDEAENRLHAQNALMLWLLGKA